MPSTSHYLSQFTSVYQSEPIHTDHHCHPFFNKFAEKLQNPLYAYFLFQIKI